MERVVMITGAGSGIGLASSMEAGRLGFTVVATVHRPDQVAVVAQAADAAGVRDRVRAEVLDVTDTDRGREVIDQVRPWALVNNAAVPNAGTLEDVPLDDARRQFEAMVFAPLQLVRLALPHMRREGGGKIVNVSSIAGEAHAPLLGWYQAAKSALSTLSDVLRQEVEHQGVQVVAVEPGIIDTPIWDKIRRELLERRDGALEPRVYDRALRVIDRVVTRASDVQGVAETIGKVLHAAHPHYRYRTGAGATVLPLGNRYLPTSVKDRFTLAAVGL